MTDDDRIARLEQAVDELRREIAALREERALPVAPSPPTYAPYARRRSAGAWVAGQARALGLGALPHDREGVEAVVGRYGTVAIAALLILMGVGAFLTWAIAEFTIGPRARVALGVVVAALLGGAGWRLRVREASAREPGSGARGFGDVLLAIALAIVHVDAWGAGPYLGLLSTGVSLAIAAAASAGLALLAWRERDQPLFVVGVGGALVAPFVTSAGPGHPYVLPVYGWLVLTSGALALPRAVRWAFATRMLGIGGAAYAAAMIGPASAGLTGAALPSWGVIGTASPRAEVPVLFALASAAGALVAGGPAARAWLALAHATTTAGAVIALALGASHGAPHLAALAGVGDALAYAALWRAVRDATLSPDDARATTRAAVTAILLPLALLLGALIALPEAISDTGAAVGAAWAALAGAAALVGARTREHTRDRDDPLLGAHVAVAGFASALVPALLLRDDRVTRVGALAAHGAMFGALFARVRRRVALLPPLVVLSTAAVGAYLLLWERPAFAYTPFLGAASIAAAATTAAWIALARFAWRSGALTVGERGAVMGAAALVALLWGREELARAVSRDVATFLLVGYFAAAGIVAILVGRVRRVPAARQAGLALALYAAFKALVQASALDAVGLRVGSYLLVGGFLLGVGWWYRAAGARAEA